MTAARVPRAELTALAEELQREVALTLGESSEGQVLSPLLESALHGPLREFLARPGKEFRARLCKLAFRLGGGREGTLPAELPLVIEVLHAGSLIVDDIEDDSDERRGGPTLHRLFGLPVALNAGNWLYFWPQRLIARSGLSDAARLSAHERMGECLLRCHEGQALDITVRIDTLPRAHVPATVRGTSERKTGALMGLSAAFGALAAGASEDRIAALSRFGCELGVGLQMLDDISGVANPARADKGAEDLMLGRATWVWAFLAEDLDSVEYADFLQELQRAREHELAAQAGERRSTDGGRALDALMDHLRFRLGVTGLRRARLHVEHAVAELAEDVGDGPWRPRIEEELRWLERRFIGG
ncbi:MAG: polyprenyl synthetase family protein [Myxococcales bacterium]|jgi:geranylgeranyl pyrophosphate synthase